MCPAVKAPEQLVLVGVLPVTLITYYIEADVWDSAQEVVTRSASLSGTGTRNPAFKLRLKFADTLTAIRRIAMRIQPLSYFS